MLSAPQMQWEKPDFSNTIFKAESIVIETNTFLKYPWFSKPALSPDRLTLQIEEVVGLQPTHHYYMITDCFQNSSLRH